MFKIITKLFTSDKRFLIGLFLILSFSFYGQEISKGRVGYSPDKSNNTSKGPGTGKSILVPNDDATYGNTPKKLVENILTSSCLTIGEVKFGYYRKSGTNTWTWNNQFGSSTLDRQLGYFNEGNAQNFGIEEGLLLSTGKIRNAMGPSVSDGFSDKMNGNASDPDLAKITGRTMYDAAVLEINFTPVGTKIEFQFVFASDEYLEYCGTQYEDAFGFFLSGPGIAGGQGYQNNAVNLAKLPNGDPITINTIHPYVASNVNGNSVPASNPAYYANNNINISTEFDGGTVILTAEYTGLISGQEYKMKMAIADASDQQYDAGVFLKARSFTSNALVVNDPAPLCSGVTTADITAPAVTAGSTIPGPYTYWRDAAASIPFTTPTVATVGTYYIKAVDSDSGCEIIKPVKVTNSTLDSSFTKQNVTCFGDSNGSIDLSVTGGTGTYTYAWTTVDGSGLNPSSQDQTGLTAGTYNVTVSDGNCTTLETVVITQATAVNPPVSGGNQTECEKSPIQTLTATATVPTGHTVVWYDQATGGNIVTPTLNYVGSKTYYAQANVNGSGCTSLSRTAVTLTITPAPGAPVSGGDQTECETSPIQTLTATATVAGGQTLVWYDQATGGSVVNNPILNSVGSVTYYAQANVTGGGCSSLSRTAVTLTITPAPGAPVSGGDQTECETSPIQTLTATATVAGGQTLVWYDQATGGSVVNNPILNSVGSVTYYAQANVTGGGCSSLSRTPVTLTITPAPGAPVSGGDQTECETSPIQTLTATATVAGGQTLVWYDQATGGSVVNNPILNSVGSVTYYAQANVTGGGCSSLSRTPVTLTITPAPGAPVSGGDQTECETSPIQTLTATATVAGGQTLVWYDQATGGSVINNPILNSVGSVTYYAQANVTGGGCSSLSRTPVTLTITPAPGAPVSGGDQTECETSPIQTLTATATVPGGQTVVWYDQATGGSVVNNPILNSVGSVTYYAQANVTGGGCSSLSRTPVTLTITPAPGAPVSGGDQTECETSPIQTLTATATVAGGQTVVWYDQATGGSVVNNPILNSVGSVTYYAQANVTGGGCSSLSRTPVTLTITPAPGAPVSGGDQTECETSPIQTLTATATVPGGQTVVWYDQATGGSVVNNPTLNYVGSKTYYAQANVNGGGCSSLSRTPVTLTITPAPGAPVSGGDQTECETSPIQTLTATATVPGGQTVVWYDQAIGGSVVNNPILNSVGSVTYYAQANVTGGGCVSLSRTPVTLTITPAPGAPISGGDQTECETSPIQTLTATATVPGGQTVVWYDQATGGSVVNNPTLNYVGTITYYAQANVNGGGCSSLSRTPVTLTITNAPDAPVSGGDQTECETSPIQTLTATATVPGGQTVVWYDQATGGSVVNNPILNSVGSVTYYAQANVTGGGCVSLSRTPVTLTITPAPGAPVSGGDQTECEESPIQTLTATATVPGGQTVVWYDQATGGSVVNNPILNSVGSVTYYAQANVTGGGCVSLSRTPVTLTITPAPGAPVSGGDQTECEESPIQTLTATATVAGGQAVVWYDQATGGSVVNNPTLNYVGTITYYAQANVTGGGCVSLTRTPVTLTITPAPSAPVSGGDQAECALSPIQTLTATATVPTGQTVVWYDLASGGNIVTPTLNYVGTITYYAQTNVDGEGCSSLTRTPVTLTLNNCGIILEKIASPNNPQGCTPVAPGESISYTFKVSIPAGSSPVYNVVLTDPLLEAPNPVVPIVYVSGDDGDGILEDGEVWTYTASYSVTQQDITNGQVQNTATVNGLVQTSGTPYPVSTTDTVTVNLCQDAKMSIVKSSTSATGNCISFNVGDSVTYKFVVTNDGDVDISNVVVNDAKLGGVISGPASGDTNNDGILNVGEVWTYNATYTINQSDIDFGSVVNIADAQGNTALGPIDATSNEVTVLICTSASIALIKTSTVPVDPTTGCSTLAVDDVITYAFSVKNTGNVTLTNINITDLVAGVTVVGGPISLAPGAEDTTTFTATYTVTQADIDAGTFSNSAKVFGTTPGNTEVTDISDNTSYTEDDATVTTICTAASIALIKTSTVPVDPTTGCSTLAVDDVITYAFSVKNTGNVTLTNINITDLVAGVTVVGGPISLAPGAEDTTTFTATYTVTQADIDAGTFSNSAKVFGTTPGNTEVTDISDNTSYTEDDATVTTICTAASIALIKTSTVPVDPTTGCSTLAVDDVITYAFSVKNTGNVTLTNINITDLVAGVTVVGGPISLAPGAEDTTTFTATYTVTQADIDAGTFSNSAKVFGTTPGNTEVTDISDNTSYTEDDATVTTICTAASIALIKTSTVPVDPTTGCSTLAVDDVITYAFSVKNTGNVTLTNINITDLVAGVTVVGGPISLAPGAEDTTTFTATYTVTQADIDAGTFSNSAKVFGTTPGNTEVTDISDNTSYTEDDATVTTICTAASIALIKTSTVPVDPTTGCSTLAVDDVITYAFSVKNTGNVTLTNINITDLVAGVTVVGGPISLAPGAEDTTTFTATYTVTQADIDAGTFSNSAKVFGTTPGNTEVTDISDNTSYTEDDATVTTICTAASIALIKTSTVPVDPTTGCSTLAVDDVITYAFSVKNTGNVTLTNINITDLVAGVTVVGGPISLAPGAEDTTTFTATYTVTQADIDAGTFSNSAKVFGTTPGNTEVTDISDNTSYTEDDATVTTICTAASIALIKTSTVPVDPTTGCSTLAVDDVITYAFSVKNTGNVTLTNINITDLVAGVTVVGGPISLAPGAEDTTTFTATYTVTQADIDAGTFSNSAKVFGTTPGNTEVTDISDNTSYTEDDATVTTICTAASIALIKTSTVPVDPTTGCSTLAVDDVITYAFSVKNTGNVTLTNINITDLVAGVTVVGGPISLAPGAEDTTTFTATYTVTQADIDAGTFSNSAKVFGTTPGNTEVTDISDNTSYTEDDATVTTICTAASIALIKTSTVPVDPTTGCSTLAVDDVITYAFSVKNTGNVTLTNINITDLVAGVTVVGGPISLAPGAEDTTTFTATYTVTQADIDAGTFSNSAKVFGTTPGNTEVTDISDNTSYTEDDATVTTICTAASIALIKTSTVPVDPTTGCSTLAVDDVITYAFSVKNTGNVTLTNINITDLVAGVTVVGGPISLAPGAEDTTTFTATYTVTQADIDAGTFSNSAKVFGTTPGNTEVTDISDNTSYTEDDATVTTICTAASIALIKTSTVPVDPTTGCSTLAVDDVITYAFSVKNTGNVTLTNINITDLVAGVTVVGGPISLAPGAEDTTTFTATYTVTQADIDAGTFSNSAKVFGTTPGNTEVTDISDNTSYTEDDATVTTICTAASIALIKTSTVPVDPTTGCSTLAVDDVITYAFSVKNTGNVTLTNINITDLVAGVTVVGGPISLAPGAEDTTTFTATYTVTQADIDAGTFSNSAKVFGTTPGNTEVTDISDNTSYTEDDATVTTICTAASIALIKTSTVPVDPTTGCSTLAVDDVITYAFSVKNTGNVTLTNINITDLVAGVTVVGGPISLAPGAEDTTTFTATYTVTQADIDAGTFSNSAKVFGTTPGNTEVTDISDDTSYTEDDATVTTICSDPAIAIVKTGVFNDENGDECSNVGETITYTFTVTNEGNVSLSNIVVNDPLLGGPVAGPLSGDTNNDGILDVTETWIYTGTYTITQGDIDAGQVTNQATATGIAPDQTTVTDLSGSTIETDDTTVIELCQNPAIAIVKTGVFNDENGDECSNVGETITYTFTVTNEGNVSLSNIVVNDPLLGGPVAGPLSGDTNNDGILDVTETWIYTGTYTITQGDIDAGQVTNQATATGIAPDQTTVTDLSGSTIETDDTTVIELCQNPAIAIVKTGVFNDENGDECSNVGETITYTFTVTNEGNVSLSNIVVNDPLLGGPVAGPLSGDTNNDGILDVTETWIYTGTYTITQGDIDAGQVTNQATATGIAPDQTTVTDLSGSTIETDDTTVIELCQNSAIAIVKTGVFNDENGDECSNVGETITYTFTVTNEGNASLSNIVVNDPLLGGPVAGPLSGDTNNDGILDVTETWIYTGTYTITQGDIDAGQVTNQATVTGIAPNQTTVTDFFWIYYRN